MNVRRIRVGRGSLRVRSQRSVGLPRAEQAHDVLQEDRGRLHVEHHHSLQDLDGYRKNAEKSRPEFQSSPKQPYGGSVRRRPRSLAFASRGDVQARVRLPGPDPAVHLRDCTKFHRSSKNSSSWTHPGPSRTIQDQPQICSIFS